MFYTKTFNVNWVITALGFIYMNKNANNPQYKNWAANYKYFYQIFIILVVFYTLVTLAFHDFAYNLFRLQFYDLFEDETRIINDEETKDYRSQRKKIILQKWQQNNQIHQEKVKRANNAKGGKSIDGINGLESTNLSNKLKLN